MKYVLVFSILALTACVHENAPPAPAPPSYVFNVEPTTIAPGEWATLFWNIPGATKVSIEAAGLKTTDELQRLGSFDPVGSLRVAPASDTTYVITCEGGTTVTCASVSVRIRVKP